MPILIAVDGPAGAGKSEISKRVAQKLGILHLNTGAMYRAVGLAALRAGVSTDDERAVCALLPTLSLDVQYENGSQKTLLSGQDVTPLLSSPEVSAASSDVSRYAPVREKLVQMQRALALRLGMVLDGRDIGTRVLPDAPVKIYLDASSRVRAQRRALQYEQQGQPADFDEILKDIEARDEQDKNRPLDPLRQAEDAVYVDSSFMTIGQVVNAVLAVVERAYGR